MSASRIEWLRTACITLLGSGYAPFASGTCGSLVAMSLFVSAWFVARAFGAANWQIDLLITTPGILLSAWLSIIWGDWAIKKFGRKDPGQFVLDEFAGQWTALLWLPSAALAGPWALSCVLGGQFLLFRLFDILKIQPAARIERWPGGWGILCDDLVAGAYANLVGQLLWRATPMAVWLGFSPAGS